jgi:subfamily B ATP-binding cassette protein MsbA
MKPADGSAPSTPRELLRHYWRVADARAWHFALPVGLILLAGVFEAASFSLLLPLTDAIAESSFDFLEESRWFGWILLLVPDSIASGGTRDAYLVVLTVALIIVWRVVKLVLEYLRKLFVVARNERYRVSVTNETFSRVLSFGRQYFDRHSLGRVDAEVGWSSAVVGLVVAAEEVLRFAVGLIVKAAIMVAISVPLSIAFVVSLPFVNFFMKTINRAVTKVSREGVEVERRMRSRVLDLLGSVPLVKAYSQEASASEAYAEVLREAESVAVRRDRIVSLRYPVEEVFILFVMLVVQAVVIYTSPEAFRPGDLAPFGAFLLLLQQALPDYKYLTLFSLKVSEEIPRLEALTGLYSDEGKFIVPSGPSEFDGLSEGIEVERLTFGYQPDVPVLHDVNATFPAGRVTAVVGHSGAGKTTFVDLIARFYDVEPGTIRFDGEDARSFSLDSLHRRMAIVSQDVWLLNRTIRDNLTFGLDRPADDDELFGALRDVLLDDFVREMASGLDTEIGDRGVRLSGGQRQRLALARALLRDPEILILDEATSALDSVVELDVARAIQQRSAERTLIIIAHRLSTIRDADQILVLHEGRLVESGGWDELIALGGHFATLYAAQFGAPVPTRS